jgi:hypothetical protein
VTKTKARGPTNANDKLCRALGAQFSAATIPQGIRMISYFPPVRRPLKIFAYDPMLGRMPLHRITVDVLNEPLKPGPCGERVQIIDYDGVAKCFYEPVNLDDPAVLMQGGLDPTEFDPRFHQQMVYAVTMKVIENFEVALGRSITFHGKRPLQIFPHAFSGANAFYDPKRHALLFGYFSAEQDNPGANLPGQTVFSCLSHDIIAHEMTHAITHRLRRYFLNPSNEDVLAFHEGFSDIIAIFQHFSFPAILREAIQNSRGDLRTQSPLVELAVQFGQATGEKESLRSAIDDRQPGRIRTTFEPHERGSILVAAVFDAFFQTYQERVEDLIRIATNGTGVLPQGALNTDLVNRMAREAANLSSAVLRMCIRAFDYLPPVDVTFGDYLRAMVTADFELNPGDEGGLRRQMVEAFRIRGIFPSNVSSLSEESLRWPRFEGGVQVAESFAEALTLLAQNFIVTAAESSRNTAWDINPAFFAQLGIRVDDDGLDEDEDNQSVRDGAYQTLHKWVTDHARELQLDPSERIEIAGVHPSFRIAQDGQLLVETIIQLAQKYRKPTAYDLGGVPFRGGSTIVVKANGIVQYVIGKPLPFSKLDRGRRELANLRLQNQAKFVSQIDDFDSYHIWQNEAFQQSRIAARVTLAAAHRGLSW